MQKLGKAAFKEDGDIDPGRDKAGAPFTVHM
jgi:hypothetical protein